MCTKRFMGYGLDVRQFCGTGRINGIVVTIFIILILQMTSPMLREVSLGQPVSKAAGSRTGLLRYPLQRPLRKPWHRSRSRGTSHFTSVHCSKWSLLDQREKSPGRQPSGSRERKLLLKPHANHRAGPIQLCPARWPLPGSWLHPESWPPEVSLLQAWQLGSLVEEHRAQV